MSDKPKPQVYEVPWKIEGRRKVLATSPEVAEEMFQATDVHDYVEEGELENFPPEQMVED